MEIAMRIIRYSLISMILVALISISSCARPPQSGREIIYPSHGITVILADGWEGEVISTDWLAWKRILKGREDFMWVFPPLTARNISVEEARKTRNCIKWRFKGVEGNFDSNLSPTSPEFPQPPGLWSMDPTKMSLVENRTITLDKPGLSGIEATARVYEISRGMGDLDAYWNTYVVTFNYGPNAYEFVMLIPTTENSHARIDIFWNSIEDVSIDIPSD